jgi:hypothetical protein
MKGRDSYMETANMRGKGPTLSEEWNSMEKDYRNWTLV